MSQEDINLTNALLVTLGLFILFIIAFVLFNGLDLFIYRVRVKRAIKRRLKEQAKVARLLERNRVGIYLIDTLTEEIKND